MLNPIFIFLIFFLVSLITRFTIMSYYPQYTYFAHVLSSFLVAIGTGFSIPFIIMKHLSFPPTYSSEMKKWIKIGFIILIFISTFLESYYGYMPQIQ